MRNLAANMHRLTAPGIIQLHGPASRPADPHLAWYSTNLCGIERGPQRTAGIGPAGVGLATLIIWIIGITGCAALISLRSKPGIVDPIRHIGRTAG